MASYDEAGPVVIAKTDPATNLLTYYVKSPLYIPDFEVIDQVWDDVLSMATNDPISTQLMRMQSYGKAHGWFDKSSNPLMLAMFNEQSNYMQGNLKEKTIERLIKLELPKLTGMSVYELLKLPTYELRSIVSIADKLNRENLIASRAKLKRGRDLIDEMDEELYE